MLQVFEIQAVSAIASAGSINKAADILNTSQPTLSKLIMRLEDRLGAKVFHRSGRGVVPTDIGNFIISKGADIESRLLEIERHALLMAEGGLGNINLGIGPIVEELLLAPAISAFSKQFPNINIDIRTEPAQRLLELLENGDLDMVVGPFDKSIEKRGFNVLAITEQRIISVAHSEHELAKRKTPVTIEEFTKYPIALPHLPPSIDSQLGIKSKSGNPFKNNRISCEHYGTLISVARQTELIVSGPRQLFLKELAAGDLVEVPVSMVVSWRCSCLVRPETLHAKPIAALSEIFRGAGSRLSE